MQQTRHFYWCQHTNGEQRPLPPDYLPETMKHNPLSIQISTQNTLEVKLIILILNLPCPKVHQMRGLRIRS